MRKTWMYIESGQGDNEPRPVYRQSEDPYVMMPDGTRLYCKSMQGARAVVAIIRLFVYKQESPNESA